MSFSGDTKHALTKEISRRRHCQLAELAALLAFGGRLTGTFPDACQLIFEHEHEDVVKKYCTLLKKCFNIGEVGISDCIAAYRQTKPGVICLDDPAAIHLLLQSLKLLEHDGSFSTAYALVNPLLIQQSCCKRAFVRGAFLCTGSVSDPKKSYHLEIVCDNMDKACQLKEILHALSLDSKIATRKKQVLVYLKDGEQIVDLLNLIEARVALMDFENARILRDIANTINRQTNCEVANSQKTISASAKQQEDILLIQRTRGLSTLPAPLQEIAYVRLEHPDVSIKELGELLDPPIGKSGVNHRLRKLKHIAEEIKGIN